MSDSSPSLPKASANPLSSLAPFLQGIKSRDLETLSMLRHALRTPLNQILGYSEMLLESADENNAGAIVKDLTSIHTCGGQLLAIINDALAGWRIETGKIDFASMRREVRTPLNAVIGYAELCLDESRAGQHVELTKDLEKIRKAAQNLFDLFESDAYPGQIDVGSGSGGLGSGTVGLGSGSGGLSRGADVVTGVPASPAAPGMAFGLTAPPMPNAKLLAVDDDDMNRDMLIRRLKKMGMGYDVSEAATGREALKKLKEGNYDLVLLDILMPDLDGHQTLEFMKADARLRDIPVIMLTALGDDLESTVRCIEAGAEDYVPKPFNPVILRARINASLEKKRLRDRELAYLAQLKVEQNKSERLLLSVLPKAIAERLKAGQRRIADPFDCTVLFADIVGFTRIAARLSPLRTVELLDEFFSNFDNIADQMELEKIKTIGDAYMMVSGVPNARSDHAEACAAAALEMLERVRVFNRRHQLDWSIRIGMNSGHVVAGIIGTKKFSYDLWGDTVNIASRMESHGLPGQIQVSEVTKKLIEGKFHCTPMGIIDIKNSAPMHTYMLEKKIAK